MLFSPCKWMHCMEYSGILNSHCINSWFSENSEFFKVWNSERCPIELLVRKMAAFCSDGLGSQLWITEMMSVASGHKPTRTSCSFDFSFSAASRDDLILLSEPLVLSPWIPVKGHPLHGLACFPDTCFIRNIETKLPIKKLWVTAPALSLSSFSTVEYSSLWETRFFPAIQLKFSFTWLPPITPNYTLIKPLDYCELFPSLPAPTSVLLQRFPRPSTRLYKKGTIS